MTARRRTPVRVRYGGADDRLLRLALLEEWGWRCYWRGELLTFSTAQIDHIIPRSVTSARLAELIVLHHLPADFDLHAPANLGPICASCNNEKRDGDYLEAPVVHAKLVDAQQRAPKVVRRVQDHKTTVTIGSGLIDAATADLTGPQARQEFLEHAPAIVQTLALLDENRVDYWTPRYFDHHLGGGAFMPVALALDTSGRTAQAIIETLFGCSLPDALADGLRQLTSDVETAVEETIEKYRGETGDIGPVTTDLVHTSLDFSDLRRRNGRLTARFNGVLNGEYNASVVDTDQWGDELVDRSAIVNAEIAFAMRISWSLTEGLGSPRSTRVRITRQYLGGSLN
ncbi:HNH endonuclease [Micromonospora sp. AB353]|uniref:HNH endonuclease n=1 Tax=Micromonospora sp. AB353 TaxID=3413282 RepID=UPI003C273427